MPSKRTFMDVAIGTAAPQRIMFELDADRTPITVENFRALCTGEKGTASSADVPMHYKNTIFHRVIDGFMLQAGDYTAGNGTGGESIYGATFADEDLSVPLDKAGLLAMANRGADTNSSQFFITLDECPHLDGKHTVFGKVVKGMEIIQQIAQVPVDSKDKPIEDVRIVNCGELIKKSAVGVQPVAIPAETRGRGRTRSISPSPSRSRSRSPSTSSSRSRSPSRDRKRSKKSSSRREKKDKRERRRKLKGLVDDYGTEAGAGGKEREETEEELDARLEREETERLAEEKKIKLAELKRRFEREREEKLQASKEGGAVVYKGRGAMRYLDPENVRSGGGGGGGHHAPSSTRGWGDERRNGSGLGPGPGQGQGSYRDREDRRDRDRYPAADRRRDDRDRERRRSPSPSAGRRSGPGGQGHSGGVEGDWRVGREMKIRGHGRDERVGFERASGEVRRDREDGEGRRGEERVGMDVEPPRRGEERRSSSSPGPAPAQAPAEALALATGRPGEQVDSETDEQDGEMGIRRGERGRSEESMELDVEDL